MKNTLKLTTALVGSMLTLGVSSAVAQTTVSGNLGLSYFATSNAATANQAQTFRGFGKESQINISNKGKLSNGMDYVAGFSIEMDGADVSNTTAVTGADIQAQQSENVYIDLISGNTTLTFGADHIQNPDVHLTNIVGFGYIGADGVNGVAGTHPTHHSAYSSYGAGIIQNVPGIGAVSFYYVPNRAAGQAVNDIGNGMTKAKTGDGESAKEVTFRGNLGVNGLDVLLSKTYADSQVVGYDNGGKTIGVKYNFGSFTVAAQDITKEGDSTYATTTKGRSYGAAYAINKDLSVGYTYGKAEKTGSTVDEIVHMVAVGYNLGPVSLQAQYKDVGNHANNTAADGSVFGVYLGTKF
jgi:hypothetical protein